MTGELQTLSGWGRTNPAPGRVQRVQSCEQLARQLDHIAEQGLIARGCGRSYGDAAQNRGGDVLDMRALRAVVAIDEDRGVVTAQAGATIRQLQRVLNPKGWALPVVPGTQDVTLGGALAADVHGKNHERDGSLGRHVSALTLLTPSKERLDLGPGSDEDAFRATLGGMGLTGVIEQATLRLTRIPGELMSVATDRTADLDATLAVLSGEGDRHRFSVSWIDALAPGAPLGRGIVTCGDYAPAAPQPARHPARTSRRILTVPDRLVSVVLRPATVRAFNELNWRHAPAHRRDELVRMEPFFFPLDVVAKWNRLYGREGFFQYQLVVPPGAEHVLRDSLELLQRLRVPVYLAILKRFGPGDSGLLSFPMPGWTLALDLPARASAARQAMDRLDELVAGAGGRVYLAKDARLRRELLAAMYPQLERWHEVRARLDPHGRMRSDLGRRLGLTGAAAAAPPRTS